ncbi:U6 snRNA-associated Sm-like protein LSm2 [Ptychographa xylographoides]|nr:U6 snRNA-associated Sm-like protein LSm2 [Ptychographa xylographoides]
METHSFFKTLVDHEVTVELKNDISIRGTLKSVDQFLNIKLDDIQVVEEIKYPHLSSVKNVFIRGSVVRYVHLPGAAVDTALLEDATRRGSFVSFDHRQASKLQELGDPVGFMQEWDIYSESIIYH